MIAEKRRRPAPNGNGTLLGVRLRPDTLERLDNWIVRQDQELSRPEAIRQLVKIALFIELSAEEDGASPN